MALWAAFKQPQGFTLIETVMTLTIMSGLFSLTLLTMDMAYKTSLIRGTSDAVTSSISTASARSRNGLYGMYWGVYIDYDDATRVANEVVVFAVNGSVVAFDDADYARRDPTYDLHYDLSPRPYFHWVDLAGGSATTGDDHEIIFDPLTGSTQDWGSIDLAGPVIGVNIDVSPLGTPSREFR